MANAMRRGVCVSCGREPGSGYRACPYCGEAVWHPLWHRAAAVVLPAAAPVLLGLLAVLTRPDWTLAGRAAEGVSPVAGFGFAAGLGLLLLPVPDGGRIASSRRELARWRLGMILGGWLLGLYAALGAACVACASVPAGAGVGLSVAATAACGAGAALFFGLPRRSLVAAGLLAAAVFSGVLQYAGASA